MKNALVLTLISFFTFGCMTAEQVAARNNLEASLTADVYAAKKQARFECQTKQECDKAFSLAKVFVHDNADMRVQSSDDTVITTYQGSRYGYCGMSVTRIPGAGDSATIVPSIMCMAHKIEAAPKEIDLYKRFADEMNSVRAKK